MYIKIIEIVTIILIPSNKIEDKSTFQIKRDITKPKIRTEIDNNAIKIEAFTWL